MPASGGEERDGQGQGKGPAGQAGLRVALLVRKWSLRGGNEKVATEVARYLIQHGHQVLVLCQKVDDSTRTLDLPVQLQTLAGLSFDPVLAMTTFAWRAKAAVRRLRRDGAIDVVLGFNHSIEQDVYRLGAGTHAAYLQRAAGTSRTPWLDRAALALEQVRFRPAHYSRLIAPSAQVKEELMHHYPVPGERIDVVPNGVDLERFAPRPGQTPALRAELGLEAEGRVAVFVGQELQRKGFDAAVSACGRAGVSMVYVGQARRPPNLPPHVRWLGERADVPRVLCAADVLLLPSHYDPFGGVVLEAYACGIPAVATRRVGATELAAGTPLEELLIEDPKDEPAIDLALARALDGGPGVYGAQAREIACARSLQAFGRDLVRALLRATRCDAAHPAKDLENSGR